MKRLFGTDGVRGVANRDLTPKLALQLGQAGAHFLGKGDLHQTIVVGRDTRLSGHMLEGALIAGITSMGIDVISLGVIPTPGVAYMVGRLKGCGGVMISASHNPIADNGIKFFSSQGFKLQDSEEEELERLLSHLSSLHYPEGVGLGQVKVLPGAAREYLNYLKTIISTDLEGLHVVVDAAHGAASGIGGPLLQELGAKVTCIHDTPNGSFINVSCGATNPQEVQKSVLEVKADLGIALDGDADRLILVDERGKILDGDFIMAICAQYLKEIHQLPKDTLVATPYSNLGLKDSLKEVGINLLIAQNGDRYVLEKMLAGGYLLGGEQSGHIIFLQHNTTGDGLLSALKVLEVMKKKGKSLSTLARMMEKYPQTLKNVLVKKKEWEQERMIEEMILKGGERLGEDGRIFVRSSGTEPVIRVMVEGRDGELIEEIALDLVKVIEELLA